MFFLVLVFLIAPLSSTARASTDYFQSGGGTVCTASDWTDPGNACDGNDLTAATKAVNHGCNATYNDTYAPIGYFDMAAAHTITWVRFVFSVPCTSSTAGGINWSCPSGSPSGWVRPTGPMPMEVLVNVNCGSGTRFTTRTWNDGSGVSTMSLMSVNGYAEHPTAGNTPGPAISAVYICHSDASSCSSSTSAADSGWSFIAHAFKIRVDLADTNDLNPCTLTMSQVDGPGIISFGDIGPYSTATYAAYGPMSVFDNAAPILAGPYMIRCVDPVVPSLFTSWPVTLASNGGVFGTSNNKGAGSLPIIGPGSTYDPGRDVGDGTPLAAVFDVFIRARDALMSKPPFALIDISARSIATITGTISNAMPSAAPGRHGSTTCSGITATFPDMGTIHYTGFAGPTTAPIMPSITPLPGVTSDPHYSMPSGRPAFTFLRCDDFEQIVSHWTWWNAARSLVDYGLFLGYGMLWLKRLQPRPSANA